jgi:serine protease Do
MKKRIFILFFLGLILSSCKNDKDISTLISDCESASFIIYTYDEYGSPSGSGSGFFIESSGIAVTNCHVLDGSVKALIITNDSSKYEIEKVIAADLKKDILKFKIRNTDKKQFPILKFSVEPPKKGDRVYCISNPLGLENSFSEGIISAFRSDKTHGKTIQFSAPISPGSSGAAVVNSKGEVVSVATFMKRGGQNLNFGILVNDEIIKSITDDDFSKNNSKFGRQDNFIILNLKSETDPCCVLNAIEFSENLTTLYLTWTNLQMTYKDISYGIWRNLNQQDEGLTIKVLDDNSKHYIVSSTIGKDRDTRTIVPLATTIHYKIFFPRINNKIARIEITESSKAGSDKWTGITLNDYKSIKNFNLEAFKNIYAFSMLKEGSLNDARSLFLDIVANDPENVEALNALGVISFAIDNKMDALYYFSKAIEANPTVDFCFSNRAIVYKSQNNYKNAIEDITKAINLNPNHFEYFDMRKELYKLTGDSDNETKDLISGYEILIKEEEKNKTK